MKKYIFLFCAVAIMSYVFFHLLNTYMPADALVPTMPLPEEAIPAPKPEPKVAKIEKPIAPVEPPRKDSSLVMDKDGYYEIDWKFLAKVTFNEEYNDSMDMYIPYPVFSPEVRFLEGKKIKIKGYVIPVEETGDENILVLSAYPYSNCFFCGNAGPESVMDIKIKKRYKKRYKRDDVSTFRGKLKLNDSDLYYLNYILEGAELL